MLICRGTTRSPSRGGKQNIDREAQTFTMTPILWGDNFFNNTVLFRYLILELQTMAKVHSDEKFTHSRVLLKKHPRRKRKIQTLSVYVNIFAVIESVYHRYAHSHQRSLCPSSYTPIPASGSPSCISSIASTSKFRHEYQR